MDRPLALLALARKGGNIVLGDNQVASTARAKMARLVLVADDAGAHSVRQAEALVAGTRQLWLQIPYSKLELGAALGRTSCALAALTDANLALAFVRALDAPEAHAEVLAALTRRAERARRSRKERSRPR